MRDEHFILVIMGVVALVAVLALAVINPQKTVIGQATLSSSSSYETGVWSYSSSLESLQEGSGSYSQVWPEWYGLTANSGVLTIHPLANDPAVRDAIGSAKIMPTIGYSTSAQGQPTFMLDAQKRSASIAQTVQEVLANDYDGISLDIEHVDKSYESAFSAYVIELAQQLHEHDKLLTVAVHPKWGHLRSDGTITNFQNWNVIGEHADYVMIMLYGWASRSNPAGPMSPDYWVNGVVDYAVTDIPTHKILVGIPFYGNDWPTDGSSGTRIGYDEAQALIAQHDPQIHRDDPNYWYWKNPSYTAWDDMGISFRTSGEPLFIYTDSTGLDHVVYFQDVEAYLHKTQLVLTRHPSIGGFAHFYPHYEDPQVWPIMASLRGEQSCTNECDPTQGPYCADDATIVSCVQGLDGCYYPAQEYCEEGNLCVNGLCETDEVFYSCVDHDGGIEPNIASSVDVSAGDEDMTYFDVCLNKKRLREWYCDGISAVSTDINCNCANGACQQSTQTPQCSDGKDNDDDGMCDYSGCYTGKGKNKVWLPPDPECESPEDTSEFS